jgi:hypothetical protein
MHSALTCADGGHSVLLVNIQLQSFLHATTPGSTVVVFVLKRVMQHSIMHRVITVAGK